MKGLFLPAPGEQVCRGLLLNSTHRHPLNSPVPATKTPGCNTTGLSVSTAPLDEQKILTRSSWNVPLGVMQSLGQTALSHFTFVLLPFLHSCPGDTSSSFLSWCLLCSLKALLGTVSWLWQKCHPGEGSTHKGSSWDVLHLSEMALSGVRKGLWLSSLELVHNPDCSARI